MDDGHLPQVGTHAEFVDSLECMIEAPGPDDEGAQPGRTRDLKSYILEADGGFPSQFDASGLQCRVKDTDLDYIKILSVQKRGSACEFFLDKRDPRFLVPHTNERSDRASDIMEKLAHDQRHAFDHAWLHSDMLRSITGMPGNDFMGFGVSYSDWHLGSEESDCASIESLNLSMSGSAASEMQKMVLENPRLSGACAHNMVRVMRGDASSTRGHALDFEIADDMMPYYPQAGFDMFWTDKSLTLRDGRIPMGGEVEEPHLGLVWRRFSYHPYGERGWDPSRDDVAGFVAYVQQRLQRGD